MLKLVAIHQPNFFPWLGYFDKIRRADAFIFLDDAQFPKTGGSWLNRVKILQQGKARWLTAPIERNYSGTRLVSEMRFAGQDDWRDKTLKTLQAAYGRAPHYDATMALVTPLLTQPDNDLAAYNIHAITTLGTALGLQHKQLRRSADFALTTTATERLIALTKAADGTGYLCGGGAEGYQDDTLFAEAGLTLEYQNFSSWVYPQVGAAEFVPGLSVLDALMQVGQATVASWMQATTVARASSAKVVA
jgi:hypothetical protein